MQYPTRKGLTVMCIMPGVALCYASCDGVAPNSVIIFALLQGSQI